MPKTKIPERRGRKPTIDLAVRLAVVSAVVDDGMSKAAVARKFGISSRQVGRFVSNNQKVLLDDRADDP